MLRCNEAEKILGKKITSNDDMLKAAKELKNMGAEWVMLRGGQLVEGRLTALLYGEGKAHFFTSYNIEGWKRHGVGSALAAAITTRLGMGDDVPTAINNAHKYVHSRVVYAVSDAKQSLRATDIYNEMMSLVAAHYQKEHSVAFYADKLNITTRYLSQVTDKTVGKSPKQVISDYIMNEAKMLLDNSRLTIQEISDRLGFSSQTMFCKFFKEQEKHTPTEYRR
jgi:hydroxymethylpyrimidine/phosphomethylpyrimidine kinase